MRPLLPCSPPPHRACRQAGRQHHINRDAQRHKAVCVRGADLQHSRGWAWACWSAASKALVLCAIALQPEHFGGASSAGCESTAFSSALYGPSSCDRCWAQAHLDQGHIHPRVAVAQQARYLVKEDGQVVCRGAQVQPETEGVHVGLQRPTQ